MMNTLNGPFAVSISYTSSLDSHYWGASKITRTMPGFDLNELPETSPANVELLQWARKESNQPPQDWYEDDDDPFKSE